MFKNVHEDKISKAHVQVRPVHEKRKTDVHALRMNWAVVTDAKGNHHLQMCWRAK